MPKVLASSFADPVDVARFKHCKAQGHSDGYCFRVGDNGLGFWRDVTAAGSGTSCALPPEILEATWGHIDIARGKPVRVTVAGKPPVICLVKDTMPHIRNITNGARIDLNPDACTALGLTPPVMHEVEWEWAVAPTVKTA